MRPSRKSEYAERVVPWPEPVKLDSAPAIRDQSSLRRTQEAPAEAQHDAQAEEHAAHLPDKYRPLVDDRLSVASFRPLLTPLKCQTPDGSMCFLVGFA